MAYNNNASASFKTFFDGWLVRQEHYLDELLSAQMNYHESNKEELKELVTRILSHYQEYYEEKFRLAHEDVFLVFSPPWFSSFERTFLWIAGFKPGLAFRIVNNSVSDLSEEQLGRFNRLKVETKVEERVLDEELARIHESIAAPPLLELARQVGRMMDGVKVMGVGAGVETLKDSMENVLERADFLRINTVRKIVEILCPIQSVKFLVAAGQLQLRIRAWGTQRDAETRSARR